MRSKGLIGFTVVALAMLAGLIGLGVWQLKRLHWKEGLIAAINARTKGDPISLDRAIALAKEGRDPT
jgi:surfeit locus 1 family protein